LGETEIKRCHLSYLFAVNICIAISVWISVKSCWLLFMWSLWACLYTAMNNTPVVY